MPAQLPIMGGHMKFSVWDEDTVVDEIVGSFELNAKSIMNELNGKMFWKNIYGSPLGVSGDTTKAMNLDPEKGSFWKGRILMGVKAEKTEKPILKLRNIQDEQVIEDAQKMFNLQSYAINC